MGQRGLKVSYLVSCYEKPFWRPASLNHHRQQQRWRCSEDEVDRAMESWLIQGFIPRLAYGPTCDHGHGKKRVKASSETFPAHDQAAVLPLQPGKRPLNLEARNSLFDRPPPRLAARPHSFAIRHRLRPLSDQPDVFNGLQDWLPATVDELRPIGRQAWLPLLHVQYRRFLHIR